jgi:hypothetical protein
MLRDDRGQCIVQTACHPNRVQAITQFTNVESVQLRIRSQIKTDLDLPSEQMVVVEYWAPVLPLIYH